MAAACGGCGGNSSSGSTGTAGGGAGASGGGGAGGGAGRGGTDGAAGRGGAGGAAGAAGTGGGSSGGAGTSGGGGTGGRGDAGANACSHALNGTTCDVPDTTCFYEMHPAGAQNYYYGCTCGQADGGENVISCCFVGNAFSPSGLTPASMPDWWLTPSHSIGRCPLGS